MNRRDETKHESAYEPPRLRVLGTLRELTQEPVPHYTGPELGPAFKSL